LIEDAKIGTFVRSLPVPHEPADTRLFTAGPLTIGVEYRLFDPVAEAAKLTPEEVAATGPDSLFHTGGGADQGVCLHVFATEGLAEYVRFDCFAGEPHYHYIVPGEGNMLVHYDELANGPMVDWAVGAIRRRLRSMLAAVGAADLAAEIDDVALAAAMDEVEPLARAQGAAAA